MSWCCFGERKKHIPHSQQGIGGFPLNNIKLFSYSDLRSATSNFHPSNKIGRGGFGIVYKGILRDGTPIAAKVLSAESRQGDNEFLTEINVITNVKHPNLVEIFGCCVQGNNRILVYEYVENSSLDRVLLGSKSETSELDWTIRSEICMGTSRGLAFLHEEFEPYIVHRDIKASNILLDRNFVPKIGDFGLAKLFPDNITHISTRVVGTIGYLAPEYALQGQLTKKADIYSFGVLILEIISGRSSSKSSWSVMEKPLLEWWSLSRWTTNVDNFNIMQAIKDSSRQHNWLELIHATYRSNSLNYFSSGHTTSSCSTASTTGESTLVACPFRSSRTFKPLLPRIQYYSPCLDLFRASYVICSKIPTRTSLPKSRQQGSYKSHEPESLLRNQTPNWISIPASVPIFSLSLLTASEERFEAEL